MPWREATSMSLKREFVTLAERSSMSHLCRRFSISRKTGYKWRARFRQEGMEGLKNRSRRPGSSPWKTGEGTERAVLRVRDHHPAWGGRKIRRRLLDVGFLEVPAASTITEILRRNGRIRPEEAEKHSPWQRFERSAANDLWQMDFKGDFPIGVKKCFPLTVLDDHSRFALLVEACSDQQRETVRSRLVTAFERYGLPYRLLTDNGGPWGPDRFTLLSVWLIRLGIEVCHSRVSHPQTLGKDERFHRTLKTELIGTRHFATFNECQRHFSVWRDIYNQERPHEALGLATPASRYAISPRPYPTYLGPIEYGPQDVVRKVQGKGEISFHNREWRVGHAFRGYPVGVRPTIQDGVYDVYFCHQKIAAINLHLPKENA
jgi:transposase InsO family protein